MTLEFRPCRAWPNSWNMVTASSQEIRTGSPGGRFHEVGVVGDDRRDVAREALLRSVVVHPGARTSCRAGHRDRSTRGRRAGPLAAPRIHGRRAGRPADRSTGRTRSRRAGRRPRTCLAQLVELQIRFHLVFIEVVLRLAHLLGVVAIVPGLDLRCRGASTSARRLHVGHFLVRRAPWRRAQTFIIRSMAASGVLAIWSSVTQWAKVGKPSSAGLLGAQRRGSR